MPKAMRMAKTEAVNDNTNSSSASVDGSNRLWQMWHQMGRRCPNGTVPIRRSTMHDVLRAKSLYNFGKKSSTHAAAMAARRRADAPDVVSGNGHEVCMCTCIDHTQRTHSQTRACV